MNHASSYPTRSLERSEALSSPPTASRFHPACEVFTARHRMLGDARPSDPALPAECGGGEPEVFHSEAEDGRQITVYLCPEHRRYIADAKTARARNDDRPRPD
jgi:hypothetical protein